MSEAKGCKSEGKHRIEALRQRVFESEKYRERLRSDLPGALAEVGIDATPQNISLVKNVINTIDNLYDGFEEREKLVT